MGGLESDWPQARRNGAVSEREHLWIAKPKCGRSERPPRVDISAWRGPDNRNKNGLGRGPPCREDLT